MIKDSFLNRLSGLKIRQKKEIIREMAILGLTFVSVILFWQNDFLIFFILISIYVVRSYFWHKPRDHILFVIFVLVGFIMEFAFTSVGLYQFANPTLLNIPFWIPLSWGLSLLLFVRITQFL